MGVVVLAVEEMHVIGGDQAQAEFLAQLRQRGVDLALLLQAVIVHLQEEIFRPEDLPVSGGDVPRFRVVVVLMKRHGHFALEAAAQGDEPFCVLRQMFAVNPRLVIHPFQLAQGNELHQVLVALLVFRQQREMERGVPGRGRFLFEERARRHVNLAPDDRLDPRLFRGLVELHRAIHHAVIGDRHRRHVELLRLFHQVGNAHRAVEGGVFRVKVEMDKGVGHGKGEYRDRGARGQP